MQIHGSAPACALTWDQTCRLGASEQVLLPTEQSGQGRKVFLEKMLLEFERKVLGIQQGN